MCGLYLITRPRRSSTSPKRNESLREVEKHVKKNVRLNAISLPPVLGVQMTYVAFSLVQMEPFVSTGELGLKTLSVRSMKVWFL